VAGWPSAAMPDRALVMLATLDSMIAVTPPATLVQCEVLGITVASHRDLERLLVGFNSAYNARRQRVLDGRSPDEIVRECLTRDRDRANPGYRPPSDPCALPKAMLVIERAKDVSQPDN
jgi:hypothetical protein